jgi:hypothetical protein
MRHYVRLALVALVFAGWLLADSGIANAMGNGRGGSCRNGNCRNGSASRSYGSAKPATSHGSGSTQRVGVTHNKRAELTTSHAKIASLDRIDRSSQALNANHPSMQGTGEERKLKHRLEIADRLDQLAEKNGNEHLRETAERMRQKAREQNDNRLTRIDSQMLLDDANQPVVAESFNRGHFVNELSKATADDESPENPAYQRLLTEERWLSERLELAERLRDLSEQKREPGLSNAADYLEQNGLNRFEKRAQEIWTSDLRLALEN